MRFTTFLIGLRAGVGLALRASRLARGEKPGTCSQGRLRKEAATLRTRRRMCAMRLPTLPLGHRRLQAILCGRKKPGALTTAKAAPALDHSLVFRQLPTNPGGRRMGRAAHTHLTIASE